MKRLFILCDGTWQDGINNNSPLTNVATLARCLEPKDSDGNLQLVYYDGGVGNVTSLPAQLIDGATGRGISAKIRNAYSFLAHNYDFERKTDQIILVGFSRGAFAVQCLASFMSQVGLLQKQYLYYLRGLFKLWAHQEAAEGLRRLNTETLRLEESLVLQKVDITACAVWDTVSALSLATRIPPRSLNFVGKKVPKNVRYAFQALALDETRWKFKPCIWEAKEEDNRNIEVSQCWFLGSHGDVGGNVDAPLGAVTLLWMIGKLSDQVKVNFNEAEIAKHLKHKYLEWDIAVSKVFGSFKETRILSSLSHKGQAGQAAWYWRFLGLKSRELHLRSDPSTKQLLYDMDIHFTVRLRMSAGKNRCRSLHSWKASNTTNDEEGNSNRFKWQQTGEESSLNEHSLEQNRDKSMEYDLLWKWSNDKFPPRSTDRAEFAKAIELQEELRENVQDLESKGGLQGFASFLKRTMVFDVEGLASTMCYPPTSES